MNILVISFNIPYPPNHGGAISQLFFLEKMVERYTVTFVTRASNSFQEDKVRRLKKYLPEINVICYKPTINNKSFSDKLKLKIIKKLSYKKKSVVPTFKFELPSEHFLEFLNLALTNVNFDIIQLEFFETLSLIPFLPSNKKLIYVCHEIKSRERNESEFSNTFDKTKNSFLRNIEMNLFRRFDDIIVFNKKDIHYLNDLSNTYYSPYGIIPSLIKKHRVSQEFERLIFLGAGNHQPNREGLLWFLDSIYIPNYDKIEMPILIFSNWPQSIQFKYRTYEKIKFLGFQKNIEDFYDNSILITPVRTGTGLRTKILNAFANKIPVMSTSLAAEGLSTAEESSHIMFFENEIEFLDKMKMIRLDSDYPKTVARLAQNYYINNFSSSKLLKMRFKLYETQEKY